MYSVQSILDLPEEDLERVLKAAKKKFLPSLLEKLFLEELVDRGFGHYETFLEVTDLSDEELYEKLPDFIIEENPTRGEAVVFQYNSETWSSYGIYEPIIVNDITFSIGEQLSKHHPIAYLLGNQKKVSLSKRNFEILKKELEKLNIQPKNFQEEYTLPSFKSSSTPGSYNYARDYELYKNRVVDYSEFLLRK